MTLSQVDSPEHKIEKERALVALPGRQLIALPCADLPEVVLQAISAIVVCSAPCRMPACYFGRGCVTDSKFEHHVSDALAIQLYHVGASKGQCASIQPVLFVACKPA